MSIKSLRFFFFQQLLTSHCKAGIREDLLENGVIIRVWLGALHGGKAVGHVSLETAQDYISFWPDEKRPSGHFMKKLDEDLVAEEGRNPEATIFLRHPQTEFLKGLQAVRVSLEDMEKVKRS